GRDLGRGLLGGRLVAGVDLRERLAVVDAVAALLEADDADRVVDRVVLRGSARAEVERGDSDRARGDRLDRPRARGENLAHERRLRQRGEVGVAALRVDPAVV